MITLKREPAIEIRCAEEEEISIVNPVVARSGYSGLIFKCLMAVTCLLALTVAGCSKQTQMDLTRPPALVSVVTAVSKDVPLYLDEVGKCVAREVVSVQPQISGKITEILFTDGQDVKKGTPLFTIDPHPFEVQLQHAQANLAKDTALKKQAEANLARDIAQAKNAAVEAKRQEDLIEAGVASRQAFDQAKTAKDALDATVIADQAAIKSADESMKADESDIESAKVQIAYCHITSPIDGRAGQRLVDLGNVVNSGFGSSPSLVVIQRMDPIYADFTITQSDLATVQENMARGTLKTEVRLPDAPDTPVEGQLTFLDNAVQDGTGTVKLRATIPNTNRRLWPGLFVKVRLVLNTLPGAILVPTSASQMSAKGPFVYVVNNESKAEMRPVTLGQQQGDLVVVSDGVKAGDRVVVAGQIAVTPGGAVKIDQPATSGAGTTASTGSK